MKEKPELKEIDAEGEDVETYKYGPCTIHVRRDECDGDGPRDWSNIFTWYSNSSRYSFDGHSITELENDDMERNEGESVVDYFRRMNPDMYIFPIYGYEHGGLTLSTGRGGQFSDPWDSGMYALAACDKKKFEEEVKVQEGKTVEDRAFEILEGEVETMDRYLNGGVYGYVVENGEGQEIDSCWGFYDDPKEVALEGVGVIKDEDLIEYDLFGEVDIAKKLSEYFKACGHKLEYIAVHKEVKNGLLETKLLEAICDDDLEWSYSASQLADMLGYVHGIWDSGPVTVLRAWEKKDPSNE